MYSVFYDLINEVYAFLSSYSVMADAVVYARVSVADKTGISFTWRRRAYSKQIIQDIIII